MPPLPGQGQRQADVRGIPVRPTEATLGLLPDQVLPSAVTEGRKGKPRPVGILQGRKPT